MRNLPSEMNLANNILPCVNESNFSSKTRTKISYFYIAGNKKGRFLIGHTVRKRVKRSPRVFAAIAAGKGRDWPCQSDVHA